MGMLKVSASPHMRSRATTTGIMLDVIIALVPALIMSVVYFGLRALILTAVCVITCILSEYISRKVMKRQNTVGDLSAVVTGLLLAMNLPSTLPLWMAVFGCVVAIVVVKQMFGGLGQNFVNPAITARIILMTCFAADMSSWAVPFTSSLTDAVTQASPMAALAKVCDGSVAIEEAGLPTLLQMFVGMRSGSMGEVCAVALIIGGIYLVARRVISPIIPLCFIGTVGIFMLVYSGFDVVFTAYQLLGGGLLLGAIFMATDYVTSPMTKWGKVIFAVGCGLITSVIRVFGSLPEGVSYSIILMNIFVPHIENFTRSKPFGFVKEKKEGKTA